MADQIANGSARSLSSGGIKKIFDNNGSLSEPIVVQLTNFKRCEAAGVPETCARAKLFDGEHFYKYFFMSSSLSDQITNDGLVGKRQLNGPVGAILLIKQIHFSMASRTVTRSTVVVIDEYEIIEKARPLSDEKGLDFPGILQVEDTLQACPPMPSSTPTPPPSISTNPNESTFKAIGSIQPCLNFTRSWKIRGKCSFRDNIRFIQSKTNKVFNFVLKDDTGKIQVTGFGDRAEKADAIIQLHSSYEISGMHVKEIRKFDFHQTNHPFELILQTDFEITPCDDVQTQPSPVTLNACSLDSIDQHKERMVNVLAVVDKVDRVQDFTSKDGKPYTKRDISLIDQSGTIITLTLWDGRARHFEDDALGKVIWIKSARVKEYYGRFSLGTVAGTNWELSPQLPEVASLYEWYQNERPNIEARPHSLSTGSPPQDNDLRTIGSIVALKLGAQLPRGVFVNVKAMIQSINKYAVYKGCETCKKKVVAVDFKYFCEKCNTSRTSFKWNYVVSIELADCTGCFWVTAFEKAAQKVFGQTAQEMAAMMEHDEESYQKVIDDAKYKSYVWRIRAKQETFNDRTTIRYAVLDEPQKVNWNKYVAELDKATSALKDLFYE